MAEESNQNPSSIRYIRGLFKDSSHIDQPVGTVRFARNAIVNHTTGAISNEEGNISKASLPSNSIVIGEIALTDDRIILFLKVGDRSEVGIYKDSVYTTLFNPTIIGVPVDTDMKFNTEYPIEGTYTEQADGDLVVYWTDDLNPPRTLNVTRQESNTSLMLYGVDPLSSPDTAYIDRLNLFPHSGPVPHIELSSVDMGGECRSGVYYLALAYTDDDHTSTNFVTVANPVSITPNVEGVLPIESYDGGPAGTPAGKSIKWTITNLNTDYKYLTAAVVYDIGEGKEARKLNDIEILTNLNNNALDIVFSGDQNSQEFSAEEILIDRVAYTQAKNIAQLDNVLYLGNLESEKDLGYQKYANFITTTAVTKTFENFDPFALTEENLEFKQSNIYRTRANGYRDPYNIFKYKGYTREEVYAFYIAFVLKNGDMSYAYHIPGRAPLQNVPIASVPELDYTISYQGTPWTPVDTSTVNEDDTLVQGTSNEWMIMNITGRTENPLSHFFQWYDFSNATFLGSNNMNFWQNLNEFYPVSEEYDIINAQDPTGNYGTLQGLNVRHHRFPSNLNEEFTTVKSSNAAEVAQTIRKNTRLVVQWSWYYEGLDTPGGASNQAGTYHIDDYGGTQFQGLESDESAVNSWTDGDMKDTADWFTPPRDHSCFVPNNLRFTPSIINALNNNGSGNSIFIFNIDTSQEELTAFSESNWKFGCGDEVQEVRFQYNGTGPGQNTNVIVGWNSTAGSSEPNCGNLALGVNQYNWDGVQSHIIRPSWANGWPFKVSYARPGWVAWATCENITPDNESSALTNNVQALGFKLSDLKIPKSIADKIQGFRIYYADRTHDNRTVLGQNPIHPMRHQVGANMSGCNGGATEFLGNDERSYFLPQGIPVSTDPLNANTTWSFHDFYLLNRRKSLVSATHIKLQYTLSMLQFTGNAKYYNDIKTPASGEYLCTEEKVYTAFFASGTHNRIPQNLLNFVIKDKAKAYINGNTYSEVKRLGFSEPIYNVRAESKVAFELGPKLPEWLVSGHNAEWRQNGWATLQPNNSPINFDHYTQPIGSPFLEPGEDDNGLMLYMANLKAFKTDVYESLDTQDLVWTGYEVLGEDLNNFILDENNTPINPVGNFTTEDIYGGDTFICRHGYRMTSNEQINAVVGGQPVCKDIKSVILSVVESTENINFRNINGNLSLYFPGTSLTDILNLKADIDLTYNPDIETGNMKYNEAYSLLNDIKIILPKPIKFDETTTYPTRVIRSEKDQGDSFIDAFRIFRANQYRVLPTNRGELWKISPFNNLLLFQMEDTLLKTKGKQRMKLDDGTEAYVGSGDIFAQDPDEIRPTDGGYMGTKAQRAAIVTPYGYFSVDVKNRRIFFITPSAAAELTSPMYGMQRWFQTNIPFVLEAYGFDGNIDNPITGMGFHAVWDERYSRVILTKRDIKPTQEFIDAYKGVFPNLGRLDGILTQPSGSIGFVDGSYYEVIEGATVGSSTASPIEISTNTSLYGTRERLFEQTGWTISFTVTPERQGIGMWTSFHDYIPYIYSYSGIDIYSFVRSISSSVDVGIYKHNNDGALGKFYTTIYPFEVEIVHNMASGNNKLFYSLNWLSDVLTYNAGNPRYTKDLNAGFTSFMVYNSDSHSGEVDLEYMINTRKTGGTWKVNQFRDMSLEVTDSAIYYTGPFTGSNYGIVNTTVAGTSPAGVLTTTPLAMFNVDGMYETFNTSYLDTAKPWNERGKFIDRFLAFRLICNNLDNNLINLYNTEAPFRIQNR